MVGVRPGRLRSPLGPVDADPSSPTGPTTPRDGEPLTPACPDDPRHRVARGAGEEPTDGRPGLPGPGAFDPGRRGVRVLAVVAVLVVLGAGLWAWRSQPRAEPVPPLTGATAIATVPNRSEPSATPGDELVVAVAGKVRRPGLVRVPAGARVADAVQAAGGALPGVDVALLNPARKIADGELILVGVTAPAAAPPPAGAVDAAGPATGGRVNLNTATLPQLDALPGVGPVLAQRIVGHREQHGGFRSVSDLRRIDGIGDARYEQLKDLVTV
ncbi:helix-hairpin-helix domain-containing protein [Micromonospora sp. WMMA1363]|uniref:helix-hairpin-helix domain-containing protein n=1 Tax=Micromonospora sp. WMMA1363 TaxID=3053985 RepID=UPI00259C8D68|nr:helix-hairpin-helix domain-containing protein [Micromonospora sp. WMMA1363]MDM4720307.1 helix-hairpin-helix domain-containing protein [Micromonospora sp. WMMA1363]